MYLQRLSSFVTQVNSVHTVYTNIYKIFLLQAYRWVPWPHSHMWVCGTARPRLSRGLGERPALQRPRFSAADAAALCVCVCVHLAWSPGSDGSPPWPRESPLLCSDPGPHRGLEHEAGTGSPCVALEGRHHRARVPESRGTGGYRGGSRPSDVPQKGVLGCGPETAQLPFLPH